MENKKETIKIGPEDIVSFYQTQLSKLTMDKAVLIAQINAKDKQIKQLTTELTSQKGKEGGK